uniref:hypothetical protein n=1 Tax=Edaphosphingomonas laterariae TaxID=861865 RepID=UPI001C530B00
AIGVSAWAFLQKPGHPVNPTSPICPAPGAHSKTGSILQADSHLIQIRRGTQRMLTSRRPKSFDKAVI